MVTNTPQRRSAASSQPAHGTLRYTSYKQHDVSRCEKGLPPILGAVCRCGGTLFGAQRGDGPAFFARLPAGDLHSFQYASQPEQEEEDAD